MISDAAPFEAQILIMVAYFIIITQFAIRWRNMQKRNARGLMAVGLLTCIFAIRIVSELARIFEVYDQVQALVYWLMVVVAWSFVIWNHARTIADALSAGNDTRPE